jgi:threonyl-tRNA synthetase
MIHRAPFGSVERFVAILIEHFAGAFPAWASPVQMMMIPVTDKNVTYAKQVADELKKRGLRVEVDDSKNRMQAKIAVHREQHIPWMLIVGGRDEAAGAVSVRLRTDEDLGAMPLGNFIEMASRVVDSKALELK